MINHHFMTFIKIATQITTRTEEFLHQSKYENETHL